MYSIPYRALFQPRIETFSPPSSLEHVSKDQSHRRYIRLFLYPRAGINEPRDRLSTQTRAFLRHAVPFYSIYSETQSFRPSREFRYLQSLRSREPRIRGWRWIMHPFATSIRDGSSAFTLPPSNHRPLIVFRYATVPRPYSHSKRS